MCLTCPSSPALQNNTSLNRVSFVVLDEADRMLDMGFEPQIREVMQNLKQRHQTLLFSATMPVEIEDMAGTYLNNPIRVKASQLCYVILILGMQPGVNRRHKESVLETITKSRD